MSSPHAALRPSLDDFAETDWRVGARVETHSNEQLNRSPGGRRWSALQCIEHLTLANQATAAAIEQALAATPPNGDVASVVRPTLIWQLFLHILEPPGRLKGFAPARLQPPSDLNPEQVLADLHASHDRLNELAVRCAGHDVNRVRFRHPFLHLAVSIGTAYLLLAAHERRHIRQFEQALAS